VIDVDHPQADAVVAAAKQRRLRLLTVGWRGQGIQLVENEIEGFALAVRARVGETGSASGVARVRNGAPNSCKARNTAAAFLGAGRMRRSRSLV